MKTKKLLIGIFIIIILVSAGYAWLGGFNSPEVGRVTTPVIHVAGKDYKGSVKHEAFGELMVEAGKLVEEQKISGDLGGIYYNDPEKHQDSIHAFIGVIIEKPETALPAGYELRTIPAGRKAVEGKIEAHIVLAPNKIFPAIFNFAKEKNIDLQDFFVERYPDARHAEVLVFEK